MEEKGAKILNYYLEQDGELCETKIKSFLSIFSSDNDKQMGE